MAREFVRILTTIVATKASDPIATDDSTQGYSVGAYLLNTTTNQAFTCMSDAVGAALWIGRSLRTVDPTVTNDASEAHVVGSTWVNTTTDQTFTCVDNTTDAALWIGQKVSTGNPTVTDDASEGIAVGTTWINTTSDQQWTCSDNTTDAALWVGQVITTSDPLITDDASEGYAVGTTWVNTTSDQQWTCSDNTTDAAVWVGYSSIVSQVAHVEPPQKLPSGTTETFNWDDGNLQSIDLNSATGDVTLTLSNPRAGATYMIRVIQGSVVRDLIWPAAVKWREGIVPVITPSNDAIDVISLYYDGANYLASFGQGYI